MLKIKDAIDLKELEKFGFHYDDEYGSYKLRGKGIYNFDYICVNSWNRNITMYNEYKYDMTCLNALYDLIKVDLVEKEDEK